MADNIYSVRQACLKCVDDSEILYDENKEHLMRIKSEHVNISDEIYGELLRNIATCQEAFIMYLKQRIIINEPRVRYNPTNNIVGLDERLHGLNISPELKSSLREVSSVGYKCLREENMLDNLVAFDSAQQASVNMFGKVEIVTGQFDMVTLINKTEIKQNIHPEQKVLRSKNKCVGQKKQIRGFPDNSVSVSPERDISLQSDTGQTGMKKTSSGMATGSIETCERAVITVILTPRNSLYAVDLYRQIMFYYLNNISRFYCLVLHIGPLVDTQELVLYEFIIPENIKSLIDSYDRKVITQQSLEPVSQKFEVCLTVHKTQSMSYSNQSTSLIQANILDLDKLESVFRQTFGARLQTVADLKMYFRYYITDCKGVKNHLNDKKLRYERYIAKKEAKKERKSKKKHEYN